MPDTRIGWGKVIGYLMLWTFAGGMFVLSSYMAGLKIALVSYVLSVAVLVWLSVGVYLTTKK